MNILLIFAVIFCNFNCIICFEECTGFSSGPNSRKPATTVTISYEYKCNSGSALRAVESDYSFIPEEDISCNSISFSNTDTSFNLTVGYKVVPLTIYNSRTVTNRSNGDQNYIEYGILNDPVCIGGKLYILNVYKNNDKQACSSKRGLPYLESDYASFRILGGRCEATCFGTTKVTYSPGLRN